MAYAVLLLAALAVVLFGAKLLMLLGAVIWLANYAYPLGLAAIVGVGVWFCWHSNHRPSHWGQPE